MLRSPWLTLLFALLLGLAGCSGEDTNGNNNNPLDGFNGADGSSQCAGVTPADGAACSLANGAFCPLPNVSCPCTGTRTISCICSGGSWSCPVDCGESLPCPEDIVEEVVDMSGDMPGDATDIMTDMPMDMPMDMPVDMPGVTPAIAANAQTLSDLSSVVRVASATSPGAGWVVIKDDNGGMPGTVLGQTSVAAGASTNIDVELSGPVATGETLHAALHTDGGAIGTWEPGSDTQVMDMGPVVVSFVATVPAATPAARLTVSNDGTAWTFSGSTPSTINPIGGGTSNQTLTLQTGWRYEIVNSDAATHPIEFIDGGMAVLLSQSAAGTAEGDGVVMWTEAGNNVAFTVGGGAAAVTAYQSANDTMLMGSITIQ